jgi:hypothetical protein
LPTGIPETLEFEFTFQLYVDEMLEVKSKFIVLPEQMVRLLALVIAGIGLTVTLCVHVLVQLPIGRLVTGSRGVTVKEMV